MALRDLFSFLFQRSTQEDRVAQYVIREHDRGRTLAEILEDKYVVNRLSPEQRKRLLDRPEVVQAVGRDSAEAAKAAVVAVTTMSQAAACWALSAGSAPVASQNVFRRSGLRHHASLRPTDGTAAVIAACWLCACQPQPMRPRVEAPSRARYFAATPLAAPVRTCPRRSASSTAASFPLTRENRQTTNAAFPSTTV